MYPRFLMTILLLAALTLPNLAAGQEVSAKDSPNADVAAETDVSERHAFNICALAIPLMNAYVGSYEYLLGDRHGLALRAEFSPLHDTNEVDGTEAAGVLNYRFHLWPGMDSLFVGAYARYRHVWGNGSTNDVAFDFDVPEFNVGLNAGYRWMIWKGFNALFAAGYGYSWDSMNFSTAEGAAKDAFQELADENNEFVDAPWYGEFSLGYAF